MKPTVKILSPIITFEQFTDDGETFAILARGRHPVLQGDMAVTRTSRIHKITIETENTKYVWKKQTQEAQAAPTISSEIEQAANYNH